MNCGQFYLDRDLRTVEYFGSATWASIPVGVAIDAAATHSRAGQVALLGLINMVARLHRTIVVAVPDAPLLAKSLVSATDLRDAIAKTAQAIDPCGRISFVSIDELPASTSVGIGSPAGGSLGAYVGADGLLASINTDRQAFEPSDETLLGAGLAACVAAAALLALVTGHRPTPNRISLHRFGSGTRAQRGSGGVPRVVDFDRVLMVGAGAVASGLLYWLRELGVSGDWLVVDRDGLRLLNTNRSIGTIASESGWPDKGSEPKAQGAARLIGGRSRVAWYDEWNGTEPEWTPDFVLPLANDRAVRRLVAQRGEARIVHATTSRSYTAELHRHVAGRDDCIVCRLPGDTPDPAFACSSGSVVTAPGEVTDASLPFLSGAAGLMLAYTLTDAGAADVDSHSRNHHLLRLGPATDPSFALSSLLWPVRDGCTHVLSEAVRMRIASTRPKMA